MPATLPAIQPSDLMPILRIHPEYETPRKQANFERLLEARAAGALTFDAAPAYIRLEPHARCNLRCCWAQSNPHHPALRPRGAASVDLARRIIDDVGHDLYMAILCHWGEPTLNPRFPDIAREFHDARVATSVHSNMTLIDQHMAERIVASGLDEISGSIDGVAQASYEKYRVLGKVERAIGGISNILETRRRLGSPTPRVIWQFLVFEHNQHEVESARRIASDLGVDEFVCFGGSGRSWDPQRGLGKKEFPPRPELLCGDPWEYLAIDWDGAVHLCCRAFKAEHVMGDIRDKGVSGVFQNDRFQLARRIIRDGYVPPTDQKITCTGCDRVTHYEPAIADLGHKTSLD